MSIHTFQQNQTLPISLGEAWEFFANPQNLATLTPEWMHLTFVDPVPEKMYEGMIMTQRIKPLWGIPLTWVTEITHIEERAYFIDEQRIGPYKFWHHEHRLREVSDGVELRDILHYALPFGLIGNMAHHLVVKKEIAAVFAYRYDTLQTMFPK